MSSIINKSKKNSSFTQKKKRINWSQRPKNISNETVKVTKLRRSLQYIFLLRKFKNIIDYKNIKLLKAFLTKYGKIKARIKTRVSIQDQRALSKAIRKARVNGLIPFICDVKI